MIIVICKLSMILVLCTVLTTEFGTYGSTVLIIACLLANERHLPSCDLYLEVDCDVCYYLYWLFMWPISTEVSFPAIIVLFSRLFTFYATVVTILSVKSKSVCGTSSSLFKCHMMIFLAKFDPPSFSIIVF